MSRLSKEQEAEIRERDDATSENTRDYCDVCQLLTEIDALRAERDEAIVGAYRAAAECASGQVWHGDQYGGWTGRCEHAEYHAKAILALTPQSALDAVERREREIAETALEMYGYRWGECSPEGRKKWVDAVLAKVGRG